GVGGDVGLVRPPGARAVGRGPGVVQDGRGAVRSHDGHAQVVGAGAVVEVGEVPGERQGAGPGGQGDRGRADAAGAAVDVVGARVGSGRGAGDQGAVAAGGGE